MSTPFIGEIRMVGFHFAPAGWALCDGQLLPISENDALFVLIGTTYGGDGQSTFALPNLQSRVPVHMGTGSDNITYTIGEMSGVETVTLMTQQLPNHTHTPIGTGSYGDTSSPAGARWARVGSNFPYRNADPNTQMKANIASAVGGSQPHENLQPYLVINFIISLYGIFPSRT